MSKYEEVALTPQQEKLWADTRTALVWTAPAYTHILYTMLNKQGREHIAIFTEDPDIPVAATDGDNLILKPSTFFDLSLDKRLFVVGHEIAHDIFDHMGLMYECHRLGEVRFADGKVLPYDHDMMNRAMDYIINDMQIEGAIGEYDPAWLWDTTKGTQMDDSFTVYRRIYELPQNKQGSGGQKQFDQHLKPGAGDGKDPAQARADRNDAEWKAEITAGMAAAAAQGKLPAGLKRLFDEIMNPKVEWQDQIDTWLKRATNGGGSYDWKKPDRRLAARGIIYPSRTGFGCGDLVVAIDNSGSITQKILDQFFGETWGMFDGLRPPRIWLVFCDAEVKRVDEIEDMSDLLTVKKEGSPGGGGTAFEPVFDFIREQGIEPEALVYLTDGDGSFPTAAPLYPVLWGDISQNASKYPWGDVVGIPLT